jgi:Flp pilus assembly protein TadB
MVDALRLIDDVLDMRRVEDEADNEAHVFRQQRRPEGISIQGNVGQVVYQSTNESTGVVQQAGKNLSAAREQGPTSVPAPRQSPWVSGAFYLFAFVVVMAVLAALANFVELYVLPVVIVSGVLLVLLVGVLQLKHDNHLSDASFTQSLKLIVEQLPLIGRLSKGKSPSSTD